jgi:hypothetical protein
MPASSSAPMTSGDPEAGPSVATILVRRMERYGLVAGIRGAGTTVGGGGSLAPGVGELGAGHCDRHAVHAVEDREPQTIAQPPAPVDTWSRPAKRPPGNRVEARHVDGRFGYERGTSIHGRSLSVRMSPGRPSTRSARMFFMISVVPPSIELARERRKACGVLSHNAVVCGRAIG